MGDKLMSAEEVADYFGITVKTLYEHRYHGDSPRAFRVGGRLRYRREDVEAWLEKRADRPRAISGVG